MFIEIPQPGTALKTGAKRLNKGGFPGGPAVKNPLSNTEEDGSICGPRGYHVPRSN